MASRRYFCVQSWRETQSKKQKMTDPTTFRKEDAANEKSKGPAGGTARQATETGTTGQVTSTSTYNDTITCRSQSIVAKAGLNSRESSYQEHFCAICCSQKVFTPNFSDTHIVELHNKFAELSLLQRHNLFYSRLFFYHRFGDPLFKLLLVGRVAEGRSRR